jgi:hypothetical protein
MPFTIAMGGKQLSAFCPDSGVRLHQWAMLPCRVSIANPNDVYCRLCPDNRV